MSTPIRDPHGIIVGYQESDGTLRDRNNKKVGQIFRDGSVYNAQREQVGSINARGDVIDRYGRQVGSIGADGAVQDWHGIHLYNGSAGPLLIDFEKKAQDPLPSRFDFDQRAREVPETKAPRTPLSFLPDGFVSPSVIGCLGIGLAVIVGLVIMFVLRNPLFLAGSPARTSTPSALAQETPVLQEQGTPAPANAPTTAPLIQQATGKVNTQILNLRQGPGTTFEIVDRLQLDTQVVIVGRLSDSVWLRVNVPSIGKQGWVAAEYITTEADLNALPVIEPPAQ